MQHRNDKYRRDRWLEILNSPCSLVTFACFYNLVCPLLHWIYGETAKLFENSPICITIWNLHFSDNSIYFYKECTSRYKIRFRIWTENHPSHIFTNVTGRTTQTSGKHPPFRLWLWGRSYHLPEEISDGAFLWILLLPLTAKPCVQPSKYSLT